MSDKTEAQRIADMEAALKARADDADAGEKLDKILAHLDSAHKRMDAIEARMKKADEEKTEKPEKPEDEATADDDEERASLVDAQARADEVANCFGERAPQPMSGETSLAYRKRLLRRYLPYSNEFKAVDIDAVNDSVVFSGIESRVFADSVAASANPIVPEDRLVERRTRDASGREIVTFFGQPRTWMRQFGGYTQAVTGVRTKFD